VAKDHYIPASVLGRFSADQGGSARERVVLALYKGRREPFPVRAKNIGYVNELYDVSAVSLLHGQVLTSVDPYLHGYETALPRALDLLENAALVDMNTWLRTLVPYVASLFVRGHDFIPRYMSRPVMMALGTENTAENANLARILELERLLAPVCRARWVVAHRKGGEPFVINDLGMAATEDRVSSAFGRVIPIGPDTVLGIFPRKAHAVSAYHMGKWWPVIEHRLMDGVAAAGNFNDATAGTATSYVIGSDKQVMERLAPLVGQYANVGVIMDAFWRYPYQALKAHAWDWHRLVTATADNCAPEDLGDLQIIDNAKFGAGWSPPLGFPINMREFPTGLRLRGNVIYLTMESPSEYSKYLIRHPVSS